MLTTLLVQPIYNAFIFILGVVPGGDIGLAIVIFTLIVRGLFYPIFTSQIRTQMALQAVQPELEILKEKYKDNQSELVRLQTELFARHRIRPLSMIGSLILQLAIFFTLSYVFFRLGLPKIRPDLLYSFVHAPAAINEVFLGFLNLATVHHLVLAFFVAASQYIVTRLSLSRTTQNMARLSESQRKAQQMQQQMMSYMLPVVMGIAAYFPAGAVGLYLLVSNLFSVGQEWLIRRKPL